jgi:hypothetical protein
LDADGVPFSFDHTCGLLRSPEKKSHQIKNREIPAAVVELGPSFIPNADVARNVCYPRTHQSQIGPFAAMRSTRSQQSFDDVVCTLRFARLSASTLAESRPGTLTI